MFTKSSTHHQIGQSLRLLMTWHLAVLSPKPRAIKWMRRLLIRFSKSSTWVKNITSKVTKSYGIEPENSSPVGSVQACYTLLGLKVVKSSRAVVNLNPLHRKFNHVAIFFYVVSYSFFFFFLFFFSNFISYSFLFKATIWTKISKQITPLLLIWGGDRTCNLAHDTLITTTGSLKRHPSQFLCKQPRMPL